MIVLIKDFFRMIFFLGRGRGSSLVQSHRILFRPFPVAPALSRRLLCLSRQRAPRGLAMLLASAARRAVSALSPEAASMAMASSGFRCLSSSSASSSTTSSHDPQLHVQLEPVATSSREGNAGEGASDSGVFTLTLCRPSARNAVGRKLLSELRGALEALASESPASARALVLRSAVPGVFCAGADLRERAAMTRLEARRFVEELRATVSLLESLPFPTVAAVDGVALGGGAEIALAADVRLVGPRASFAFPEARLGIIPG